MEFLWLFVPGIVVVLALIVGFLAYVRLLKKTSPETALVRTGVGGMKVVTGGGVLVVPGMHKVMPVNMTTMTITVEGGDGLITKDSRRVDATAQFFIRVKATEEAIKKAAESLGERTHDVDIIRKLLEGKVQGTMRAITASMDLIELHRSRAEFEQQVKSTLNNDLEPNGLELESVAMTRLDETPIHKLDENNSFDITGLRARSELVASMRRERVQIEEAAEVEIARTQKENRVKRLEIEKEERERSETQRIEIATLEANAQREEARITEETAKAREEARINRERAIREAEIESEKEIETARQRNAAEIARSSEAQSIAEAKAAEARATAIAANESIDTARELAIADREKQIAVIEATKEAEQRAMALRVQARGEREAAEDQAAAVVAKAEADAQAIKIAAAAIRERGEAEAHAKRALVAAENELSPAVMAHKERLAKIEALPAIISAMVEPVKHIESFRVNQITGLGGVTGGSAGADGAGEGVMGQVFRGIRENAVALPVLKALGADLGVSLDGNLEQLSASLVDGDPAEAGEEPASEAATEDAAA